MYISNSLYTTIVHISVLITESPPVPINLCTPSPCGPYSQCRELNGHAVCVCVQGYIGNPPNCRPECTVSSDCNLNRACSNQKCIDPCPGACGQNARCIVVNHNPVCTCLSGYSGDPFTTCQLIRKYYILPYNFKLRYSTYTTIL